MVHNLPFVKRLGVLASLQGSATLTTRLYDQRKMRPEDSPRFRVRS